MAKAHAPELIVLSSSESDNEEVVPKSYQVRLPSKSSKTSRKKDSKTTTASASAVSVSPKKKSKKTRTDDLADKELKKANQQRERELKKANLQREKELKKAENEIRKTTKPGEAFKFMTVLLDPNFPQKEKVERFLDLAEIRHSLNHNLILENSLLFQRESVYQAMDDALQLRKVSKFAEEKQVLIFLEPDEIIPKIVAQMALDPNPIDEDNQFLGVDEEDIDFITYVNSIKTTFPDYDITLLFYGMENYFKKIKRNEHQEFRERVLNAGNEDQNPKKSRKRRKNSLPVITRFDFQNALIELQLKTKINYRIVNNANELGLLIVQYTKAIADAPFKRAQREQSTFDWYALADSSGSVKVEKDGIGLSALWLGQIQQFNNVGIDTAQAIFKKYPTPLVLAEAYQNCNSQEEAQTLLRDLNVRTGFGPLQKTRKLGPELSKKFFRFFTSSDPERCLGSTNNNF